ncbi:MAG: thioredoxin-disulfide reductase [Clostridia bacterium]|nr:thioredoxin-disulfide reductase [Clostridia bacterium]
MYDIIIIGGGPAGLSCAIYARRAGLSCIVIERGFIGGQMTTTYSIENYPGIKQISGFDLAEAMRESAESLGCEFTEADVTEIRDLGEVKEVYMGEDKLSSKVIVLAMGAYRRKLGVNGEDRFTGSGVSYCATCDGNFFKDKNVTVVGGGNTALEDALYLSGFANKVTLMHRRDEFRGARHLSKLVLANDKIDVMYDTVLTDISGKFNVSAVTAQNVKTKEKTELPMDGVFIAVGTVPETGVVKGLVTLDEAGYILTDETLKTNIPGIFAAGDIRKKELRQVVTAAADGAIAAHMAGRYINEELSK